MGSIISPGEPITDIEEFLLKHKEKVAQGFEKHKERSLKKIDKLIKSINES
jgi:hypothetical protein